MTKWKRLDSKMLDQYKKGPIFIVGAPRSGTTVMRDIIDSHPDIFCPHMETFYFDVSSKFFHAPHIWEPHYKPSLFDREDYIEWLRDGFLQLMANFGENANKTRFGEKTPSHTQTMDLIKEVFPDAQFIHMIRNAYDVCSSLGRVSWGPKQVERQAQLWLERVSTARRFGMKMSENDYCEVKLEDLKKHFEDTVKRVCSFLGETYFSHMTQYHLPENNSWRKKLPSFSTALTDHGLASQDIRVINEVTGKLLTALNYEIKQA